MSPDEKSCVTWVIIHKENFSDISPYESRPGGLISDVIHWIERSDASMSEHIDVKVWTRDHFHDFMWDFPKQYKRILDKTRLLYPSANLSLQHQMIAATWAGKAPWTLMWGRLILPFTNGRKIFLLVFRFNVYVRPYGYHRPHCEGNMESFLPCHFSSFLAEPNI